MHDDVLQFVSKCAKSKVGRFVFVAYLIYSMSMVSYFYDHLGDSFYPFRFYGERELFQFTNAFQIALIHSLQRFYGWQASKLSDALSTVYIALPWWLYGYAFELVVKRIAEKISPKGIRID